MNIKLKKYIDIILILIFSTALYKTHAADASKDGEFKHEVRQFEKSYDNQQAEQISLMV